MNRSVLNRGPSGNGIFQQLFYLLRRRREAQVQNGVGLSWYHIRSCAPGNQTEVARGLAKDLARRPGNAPNVVQHVEQSFDCRLSLFRISRVGSAAAGMNSCL